MIQLPPLNRRQVLKLLAATGGIGGMGALPTRALAQRTEQVVLYTTLNAQSVETASDIARELLPHIKPSTVAGGSSQLLKRIEAEAGQPKGDLFWTSSANVMHGYRTLFEPYRSAQTAAIPHALHGPDDLWMAANLHIVVGMINTRHLPGAAPTTWADLTDRRFKGKIIIGDPGNSSTAFTALWGIERVLGTEGLRALARNTSVSGAASHVVRSVGQGEYAVGITFESTAYPYVAGGQKEIGIMYPADGTFTVADNMAMVKNAPNPEAAKRMYDLLLSREMQLALLQNAFRRPSRTDIDVSKHLDMPPLADIKIVPVDEAEAAAGREAFLARWRAYLAEARSA
ncbi:MULTISPECIES: extracellular solute-binding protein [Achromobacter]|nr:MULTISPECIES: extracellular solute-binding protein [Achromobacter]AZS78322.1 extracellular solute-binding protein [Achromobacter spanius]MCD0496206.1 extracellular solute-binding protein [Achromobacter sp. MY14]MCW3153034.1 extracellular solute-binding protein [Achromobacter spanius]